MKKLFLLSLLVLTFSGCSIEDDGPNIYYEVLPVDSFIVPDHFTYLGTHEIKMYYKKPTNCHNYGGIFFEKKLNERIIAVQSIVNIRNDCQPFEGDLIEVTFDFEVVNSQPYIFKFFKGKDDEGNFMYDVIEIPVLGN
jgi:hypothetical protein